MTGTTGILARATGLTAAGLVAMAALGDAAGAPAVAPAAVLAPALFPYRSHHLQLETGARIHYVDEGEGPVLLLLHGNPTWSFLYRHLIARLESDFRVVVPDYPGFGLSTAPPGYRFTAVEHAESMAQLVERLDLRGVTVMMQDWGGPIGLAIAERHPERFDAFVIGNTWAWPLERVGHKVFSAVMGGWPGRLAAWCCNGVVRFFLSQGMERKLTNEELSMYLAPFAERAKRTPTHVFPAQLRDAGSFLEQVHEGLAELSDRPALILWGLRDFAFREPERTRFEALFPDHHTVLLENAGHFIQEDAPEEIAAAIRAWHPAIDAR